MKVKRYLAGILSLLMWGVFAGTALAQEPRPTPTSIPNNSPAETTGTPGNGSIRGTVYQDANSDGKCGGGDPVMAGVPIRFSSGGNAPIYLQTGSNGTYGLVAVSYATWQVSAEPPAGWVVSSAKTIDVTLVNEDGKKIALGVDFCVAQAGTGGGGGSTTLLPEAGAPIAPALLGAVLGGMLLIAAGLGLEWQRRQKG